MPLAQLIREIPKSIKIRGEKRIKQPATGLQYISSCQQVENLNEKISGHIPTT